VAGGIVQDLKRLTGGAVALAGREAAPYRYDSTVQRGLLGDPAAVVLPTDAGQLAAVVSYCQRQGLAVVPRGGGTGLVGGATPVDGGVVLSCELLGTVAWEDERLGLLRLGAGVPTAHAARIARERGWYFGPDPGGADRSRIGGNVATNAGGPHALKYGRTGAYVVGMEVVVGEGEVVRLGEWGRRDSGGYDLIGLLVGSEGTLGVIAEVVLKLRPAPGGAAAGVLVCEGPEDLAAAVGAILESGLEPAVLDFIDGQAVGMAQGGWPVPQAAVPKDGAVLLVETDGRDPQEAQRRLAELAGVVAEAGALPLFPAKGAALWSWRDGLGPLAATELGGRIADDLYCPPPRLGEALAALRQLAGEQGVECRVWGHAGEGVVHASFLFDPERPQQRGAAERAGEAALDLALALGGGICGEHGIGLVKAARYAATADPERLASERAVKAAFDPRWLFNPGKKLVGPQLSATG
jgi:FAD/FMN-containing dehydrogenase